MDINTAINDALAELRPGLQADGFDLRAEGVDPDGAVRVVLEAGPQACMDCLVPDEVLVSMLEDSIRRADPRADSINLVKKGF